MIFYILFFVVIISVAFFLGMVYGENKSRVSESGEKLYKIEFFKTSHSKNSEITRELINYCDIMGTQIRSLNFSEKGANILSVYCSKDQYFLLLDKLTDNDFGIEIKNISF